MYIQLNGQIIYYEKEGEGEPVILLHGNCMDHNIFDELAAMLKKEYMVILPDTRGHGKSATPKEYHYQDFADDLVELCHALFLDKVRVIGYSDGAIAAILAASKHPELFSGLVLCSANLTPNGLSHSSLHNIRKQFKKTGDERLSLMLKEPSTSVSELKNITCPTVVVAGDKDIVKRSDTEAIANAIPGSKLMILEGETHESYISKSAVLYDLFALITSDMS